MGTRSTFIVAACLAVGVSTVALAQAASTTAAVAAVSDGAAAPLDPAAEKARLKAVKDAEKAKAAQLREWKRIYGPGPYPDEIEAYSAKQDQSLQHYYRVLYNDGEHNAVLNFQRLGLLAMEKGLYRDAEKAFDGALNRIEAFYGKDKQADKADNLTQLEVNKDYKGEPYERAMAYYYRGLLYLRAGDYDNARASFKAAEYQDTVSSAEQFQSDFAMLNYLSGWASHCAGDKSLADEAFTTAAGIDASLAAPAANANLLVIAELGTGPVKVRKGQYNEAMGFERGVGFAENGAVVQLTSASGTQQVELKPAADLYGQASTRGGRAIDSILNGKAQWKGGLETAGNAVMQAGLMSYATGSDAGAYAMGLGLALSLFSSAVKPTADIRNWDTLPDQILIGTESVKAGDLSAQTKYLSSGTALDISGTAPMVGKAGKCSIVWSRSQSVAGYAPIAPNDDPKIAAKRKKDPSAWQKDQAFRAVLQSQ